MLGTRNNPEKTSYHKKKCSGNFVKVTVEIVVLETDNSDDVILWRSL